MGCSCPFWFDALLRVRVRVCLWLLGVLEPAFLLPDRESGCLLCPLEKLRWSEEHWRCGRFWVGCLLQGLEIGPRPWLGLPLHRASAWALQPSFVSFVFFVVRLCQFFRSLGSFCPTLLVVLLLHHYAHLISDDIIGPVPISVFTDQENGLTRAYFIPSRVSSHCPVGMSTLGLLIYLARCWLWVNNGFSRRRYHFSGLMVY